MREGKRFLAVILALVLTVAALPAEGMNASAKKATVKSVTVQSSLSGSKKTVYVAKGKKVKLSTTVNVSPNKKANRKVTYKSSRKSVATVSAKGVVKGVKSGKAKITVRSKINKKKKATITVKVMKSAVSKVTLSQTALILKAGDSAVLKATVSPDKGAATEVAWTSSNEKVATVNAKGFVTAVAAGTANITANAIDGSGRKASCAVTVANADAAKSDENIVSMEIEDYETVTFQLSKAVSLRLDQISIMMKKYEGGTYVGTVRPNKLLTSDMKNYTVVLENGISYGAYLRLAIPSLNGTVKTMEKQYLSKGGEYEPIEFTYTGRVGMYLKKTLFCQETSPYFLQNPFIYDFVGYSKFDISGLPQGLKFDVIDTWMDPYLLISGKPEKVGVSTAVIEVEDELGGTGKIYIHFLIGSDTELVGAADPIYSLTDEDGVISERIGVAGGSGAYKYKVVADSQNSGAYFCNTDSEGYSTSDEICMPCGKAGDYTVTVQAVDMKNPDISCDIVVEGHIKDGVTVSGHVKDAEGKVVTEETYVTFENCDDSDLYCGKATTCADSDGNYSIYIAPGTYNIKVEAYNQAAYYDCYRSIYDSDTIELEDEVADAANASCSIHNQLFAVGQSGYDFVLPVYKVELVPDNADVTINDYVERDDEEESGDDCTYWLINGKYAGAGTSIYLKAGTYELMSIGNVRAEMISGNWFEGGKVRFYLDRLTAAARVADKAIQATVSKIAQAADGLETTYPAAKDTEDVLWLDLERELPSEDVQYYAYDSRDDEWTDDFKMVVTASVVDIEEAGDYELSSAEGFVNLYNEQGSKVIPSRIEEYTKQYDNLEAGTYYVGTGEYELYDYNILLTHQSAAQEQLSEESACGSGL